MPASKGLVLLQTVEFFIFLSKIKLKPCGTQLSTDPQVVGGKNLICLTTR